MIKRWVISVLGEVVIYCLLLVAVIFYLSPVVWTALTSIKKPLQTFAIPPVLLFRPTFESYRMLLFEGHHALGIDFLLHARNSIIVSILSTITSILAACLAAYSLSRFFFKGKKTISFLIIATRMLPPIATIIPLFLLVHKFRLLDTHFALIIAYTALNIPFATWMLRGFMDEVPKELEEAAMIDGCSRLGALVRILLPLIAPGVAATSIFSFLLSWNDFPIALVLTTRSARTLPLITMSFITEEGIYWGPMCGAATLILAPAILFVMLAQKHIAKGLTMGAVKG